MAAIGDMQKTIQVRMVTICYRNHRGEVANRSITPHDIWFGRTEWHPDDQWILEAFDHDKQAERSFAMRDILSWKPYEKVDEP